VDTSPYPSGTLTDADLQNEVLNAVNTNNWPWYSSDVEFFVFTAKGENSCYGASCSFTQFCAYHSNFAASNGLTTASVLYANMPYAGTNLSACGAPSSPNNDLDADSEINLLSHEHMETVTGSARHRLVRQHRHGEQRLERERSRPTDGQVKAGGSPALLCRRMTIEAQ